MKLGKLIVFFFGLALYCTPALAEDCSEHIPYGIPVIKVEASITQVCHTGYLAFHDDDLLVPRLVSYRLTAEKTMGCIARGNKFHAEDALPEDRRATPNDYTGSGYDRGHQAPAADFAWDKDASFDSFSMVNMAPQVGGLNRQQWERLEETVRAWADNRGDLLIYVGPVVLNAKHRIGKDKVVVPTAFWKVIVDTQKHDAIAFAMPQKAIPKGDLAPWQTTVKQIEQSAGIELPMPDEIAKAKETDIWESDIPGWKKKHTQACAKHKK